MATPNVIYYDVDYTGNAPANRIEGEQHILNRSSGRKYRVIIPKFAPFFANDTNKLDRLQISHVDPVTGVKKELLEGKDYYLTHWFLDATRACARAIYGSIEILDDTLTGIIVFDHYQTLGGIWNISEAEITEVLASKLYNPRVTAWEQIVNLPERFPVVDHEWDLVDLVGANELVQALEDVVTAIAAASDMSVLDHINDRNNPHEVTKAQVGLGLVTNYAVATINQAMAGEPDKYITPYLVHMYVEEVIRAEHIREHINDLGNPHKITPSKIGTYSKEQIDDLIRDRLGVSQTAANSILFNGYTVEQFLDIIDQAVEGAGGGGNADTVYNMTLQELTAQILNGKAADSEMLDGKTLDEILEMFKEEILPYDPMDRFLESRSVHMAEYVPTDPDITQVWRNFLELNYTAFEASDRRLNVMHSVLTLISGTRSYSYPLTLHLVFDPENKIDSVYVDVGTNPDIELATTVENGTWTLWVKTSLAVRYMTASKITKDLSSVVASERSKVETDMVSENVLFIYDKPATGGSGEIDLTTLGLLVDFSTSLRSDFEQLINSLGLY